MGGNLVTKYLGESRKNLPNSVIAGISICQPYDALKYVFIHYNNYIYIYI